MTSSQDLLATALAALQAMPQTSGWCLLNTRKALASVNLNLPGPMPSPNNTALANYQILSQNPARFGWRTIGLDDPQSIKLVYFDHVALLNDPPRYAGHVGLLAGGTIYSDSNYPLTSWWRGNFAGAFVPLDNAPRLIIAFMGGPNPSVDGRTYQEISSQWDAQQSICSVDTAALQQLLGTNVPGLAPMMPIRDAMTALGFNNCQYNLTHLQDPDDPAIYVFT